MAPHERLSAFGLILCAIAMTVTGELFLKSGMNRVGPVSLLQLLPGLARAASIPQVWIGCGCIGSGAVLWLVAISRVPLSWAYPILSLGYILVLLFSRVILEEPVPAIRWLGTVLILLGVFLVFRS